MQSKDEASRASAQVEQADDGSITIRIVPPPVAGHAPPLLAFPFGLEAECARRLIKNGTLPAVKLGRLWYARSADVAALVDVAAKPRPQPVKLAKESTVQADLSAIARAERKAAAR